MSSNDLVIDDDIWNLFDDLESSCNTNKNSKKYTCINKGCNSSHILLDENIYICEECNTIQDKFIDSQIDSKCHHQ